MTHAAAPTRTAPARPPDGWWMSHPRYRPYVLFTATGLVLALDVLMVMGGVRALAAGAQAWEKYLSALASPFALVLDTLLFVTTLFFSIRFLRLGIKLATFKIGPVPAMPGPVVAVAQYGGLAAISALILLVLSGVIL